MIMKMCTWTCGFRYTDYCTRAAPAIILMHSTKAVSTTTVTVRLWPRFTKG